MSNASSRFRFSVRATLLAVAVIAFVVHYWNLQTRLRTAESELRKRRDETGQIDVKDTAKVHVIALDSTEPNTWKWRLFIPKGHRYMWNVAAKNIPNNSPPKRPGRSSISNREYWQRDNEVFVTARLQQTDDENWSLGVTSRIGGSKEQMSGVSMSISKEQLAWQSAMPSRESSVLGKNELSVLSPDEPIILLSQRAMVVNEGGDADFSKEPTEGFMIWLSPFPSTTDPRKE